MKPLRFWEIDFARGIAVLLMVAFNYSVTLDYFRIFTVNGGWDYWWLFPRLIAGAFIFLSGASFLISSSKFSGSSEKDIFPKSFLRGAKIFLLGMLATAATAILTPNMTIWFGILHFFGISIMLMPFFRKFGRWNLLFGILLILTGIHFSSLSSQHSWLLWLGIRPEAFQTFDYFPLLPWFGLSLIGIFSGSNLYNGSKRKFSFPEKPKFFEPICLLGRRSLAIYVLHQPILVGVLYFLGLALF